MLRQSELMNSGVMVLTPSQSLYQDMIDKAGSLYSYTGKPSLTTPNSTSCLVPDLDGYYYYYHDHRW